MITIDFSNPAQMALLSFAVALAPCFTLAAGILVGKQIRGGLTDFIPACVFAGIFIGISSLLVNIYILISKHL